MIRHLKINIRNRLSTDSSSSVPRFVFGFINNVNDPELLSLVEESSKKLFELPLQGSSLWKGIGNKNIAHKNYDYRSYVYSFLL